MPVVNLTAQQLAVLQRVLRREGQAGTRAMPFPRLGGGSGTSPALTTINWRAGFGAVNSSVLETWAVDADTVIVPPETALRGEVIPDILFQNDGCAKNDDLTLNIPDLPAYNFGDDEVIEPDPETTEQVLLAGETFYFVVEFVDAYTVDATHSLNVGTVAPDFSAVPDGDKHLLIYSVSAESLPYVNDAPGIERTGIKFTITQHNEGCLELIQPSVVRWARTKSSPAQYEYAVDIYANGADADNESAALAIGGALFIDDFSDRLLELERTYPVVPHGSSYRLSGYYML